MRFLLPALLALPLLAGVPSAPAQAQGWGWQHAQPAWNGWGPGDDWRRDAWERERWARRAERREYWRQQREWAERRAYEAGQRDAWRQQQYRGW